jgi:hypothetical protein
MKLQSVGPPERGSLSVVYSCPACGYEMAMLTNAYETQVVQSLGVRIGPGPVGAGSPSASHPVASAEPGAAPSGCPFSAMIAGTGERPAEAGVPLESGHGKMVAVRWTAAAEARLANIPEFVRPMARTGIERFAAERGAVEVDETVLDAAREFYGM